jgi:hypothetical protein
MFLSKIFDHPYKDKFKEKVNAVYHAILYLTNNTFLAQMKRFHWHKKMWCFLFSLEEKYIS